jgi:hypothetical protein
MKKMDTIAIKWKKGNKSVCIPCADSNSKVPVAKL